jgi:hypothetical protein
MDSNVEEVMESILKEEEIELNRRLERKYSKTVTKEILGWYES